MGYSVGQEGNKTGARQSGGLGELRAFFHIIFSTLPISERDIEGVSTLPISFASIELGASSVTVLWGVHLRFYVTTSMSIIFWRVHEALR